MYLFNFFGRLIGIAIRSNVPMPLDFPSLFWKQLIGETPSREDLLSVDVTLLNFASQVSAMTGNLFLLQDTQPALEDEFNMHYQGQLFYVSHSATPQDLIPNGNQMPVT
jgi:hypothetical protein